MIIRGDGQYDTVVFDSTHRIPYRVIEHRGDEMIHNWICPGGIVAPHFYAGFGLYRFDKSGMTDIQLGWYPSMTVRTPMMWDMYVSVQRMFFLKRKSKNIKISLCIDREYTPDMIYHYHYNQEVRRDKFYGVVAGAAYEGLFNLKNKTSFYYSGEDNVVAIQSYYNVSLKAGLARMRCKNAEWLAPNRGRRNHSLRGSSMSRLSVGLLYFPLQEFKSQVVQGTLDPSVAQSISYETLTGYFSWEGRLAFVSVKREWGLYGSVMFVAPGWNRENDYPFSLAGGWGVYVSLDKRNPDWRKKYEAN